MTIKYRKLRVKNVLEVNKAKKAGEVKKILSQEENQEFQNSQFFLWF